MDGPDTVHYLHRLTGRPREITHPKRTLHLNSIVYYLRPRKPYIYDLHHPLTTRNTETHRCPSSSPNLYPFNLSHIPQHTSYDSAPRHIHAYHRRTLASQAVYRPDGRPACWARMVITLACWPRKRRGGHGEFRVWSPCVEMDEQPEPSGCYSW